MNIVVALLVHAVSGSMLKHLCGGGGFAIPSSPMTRMWAVGFLRPMACLYILIILLCSRLQSPLQAMSPSMKYALDLDIVL